MTRSRSLLLGWFAFALLVSQAAPAFADLPGPYPWSKRPPRYGRYISAPVKAIDPGGEPTPPNPPADPARREAAPDPKPMWPDDPYVPPAPRRSGPFRSCGSGMGLGLAGIGLAWGTLWLGNRFARATRSPSGRG
jgi:hypothetical protein